MSEIRKITLQFPSLRAFLAEYGERISADGMLLRGAAPPEVGSTVDIEVVVAEGMRLLRARGETLWSETAGEGRQDAAVVRFDNLDGASRRLIDKIVEQRRRDGAEVFDLADVPGPREARLRDLTVPAAAEPRPAPQAPPTPGDAIFDLAAPPEAGQGDLFPHGAAGAAAPPAAGPPADPEAAAQRRPPPVPLLADDEPAAATPEPVMAPPEPEPTAAAAAGAQAARGAGPDPAAAPDLSDLFGGDGPETTAGRGQTEAFPRSFVDEVEAELEAADGPSTGYTEMDTGELEVHLGSPLDDPDLPALGPLPDALRAPAEEAEAPGEPEVEVEEDLSPPAPAGVPAAGEDPAGAIAEPEPEAAPAEAHLEIGDPEPPVDAVAEDGADARRDAVAEAAAGPEADTASGAEGDDAAVAAPPAGTTSPRPGVSLKVAEAFNAAYGPETVEIPVLDDGPPPAPDTPPPVVDSPVLRPPPVDSPAAPAPAPPMEDNLLSIPELGQDAAAGAAETPRAPAEDLPPASQSLRGAASSSRHLGTWLLIALLVGALGVAGFFLMRMIRREAAPAVPPSSPAAARPAPPPAAQAPSPAAAAAPGEAAGEGLAEDPPAIVVEPQASAGPAAPATEEAATPATEEAATPATGEAAAAAAEPPAALTGLDGITWTETASETTLVLLADGAIRADRVEVVPIGGDQPRLVIKIAGVQRAFQPPTLAVGTAHVVRVRTGLHSGGELHVVVDLAAPGVVLRQRSAQGSRMEIRLGPE